MAVKDIWIEVERFITHVAVRVIVTTVVCVAASSHSRPSPLSALDFLSFLMETGVIVLLNGCAIFMIGFSQVERKTILTVIKTKVVVTISRKIRIPCPVENPVSHR